MNIRYFGDGALLVEVEDSAAAQHLRQALLGENLPGVFELVPGHRSLLIAADPLRCDLERLSTRLPKLLHTAGYLGAVREHVIPVRYKGTDLRTVAETLGMSVAELIRRHSAPLYTVAFLGFAPGFPYLTGLDPALRVARLAMPRARVPSGSVAIADEFTGIYPQATPGGWRLLGHTDIVLFDPAREPPALFTPGDRVRFAVQP